MTIAHRPNPRTIEQQITRDRERGWAAVVAELERLAAVARAEQTRLLGPDRGE